jgi:hypothetical protein
LMGTYAQDLGFAPVQVALRAAHDPSVAAKHHTGNVPRRARPRLRRRWPARRLTQPGEEEPDRADAAATDRPRWVAAR